MEVAVESRRVREKKRGRQKDPCPESRTGEEVPMEETGRSWSCRRSETK